MELDPNGLDQHQSGAKLDYGKPLPYLVLSRFSRALIEIVEVGTYGAEKYTPDGWIHVEDGENRYREAEWRHQLAIWCGEEYDESGCLHEAHRLWNALAALELKLRSNAKLRGRISRPKKS